jgi:N6-L-threonylcarbamoyladenine synthase
VTKSCRAVRERGVNRLCVGGGVAANPALRSTLLEAATRHGFRLVIAPPELCTDNAVMGAIGWELVRRGEFADLGLDVIPGLQRGY